MFHAEIAERAQSKKMESEAVRNRSGTLNNLLMHPSRRPLRSLRELPAAQCLKLESR